MFVRGLQKTVNRWVGIILVTSVLLILPGAFIWASNFTNQVDNLFQKWNNTNSPGLAVGVIKDGKLIYQNTYGMANLSHGVPLTTKTVFNMGSNSKQFTAFCIYLLEAEGKLSLQDDIRKYIPEAPDFGTTITIQHLIYHTSGFRDYLELMAIGGWNLLDDLVNKNQALALVSKQKTLNFSVGTKFLYCNTGYMLLAEIVARISGLTFPEFVRERIFEPLGMKSSRFHDYHYNIIPNSADSYMPNPDGGFLNFPINTDISGEGGLLSTLDDLLQWDQNFYSPKVGSLDLIARMLVSGKLKNGTKIDYGSALIMITRNERKVIFHGGDIAGYHSNIVRYPDDQLTILTMANTAELDSGKLLDYSFQIADKYFQDPPTAVPNFRLFEPALMSWGLGGTEFTTPDVEFDQYLSVFLNPLRRPAGRIKTQAVVPQMTADSAKEYEGRYYSDELDIFYTVQYDGKGNLLFKLPRQYPYTLSTAAVTRDNFTANESDLLKGKFLRNTNKQVIGFVYNGSRVLNLRFDKAEVVKQE